MNPDNRMFDPEVINQLELLQDTPPRDMESAQAGRQNFLNQANSMKRPVSIAPIERLNKWIPKFNSKERRSMFTAITTIVVSVVMLFGGATATVYASQESSPIDLLYAIKTWSEDVHLGLTNNPQTKFNLVEGYVLRRFAEVDYLVEEGDAIPSEFITRLENQLNYMLQLTLNLKDEDMEKTILQVRSMLHERVQLMNNQGENIPEWANPAYSQIQQMLNERLRRIETGIDEPLKFEQQMESPGGNFGTGSGSDSSNREEITPNQQEQRDEKPSGQSPCDPTLGDCGSSGEPEYQAPIESPMKGGQDQGYQDSGETSNQENNSGNSDGRNRGGKP